MNIISFHNATCYFNMLSVMFGSFFTFFTLIVLISNFGLTIGTVLGPILTILCYSLLMSKSKMSFLETCEG